MLDILLQLVLFGAKTVIIFILIAAILILFFVLASKGKGSKDKLSIKHLNKKYSDHANEVHAEILTKKEFKSLTKRKLADEKHKSQETKPTFFLLNFLGDMKASGVTRLSQEISTVLSVIKPGDEVIVRIESAGGFVHGYGLAAAELMRLRQRQIPLTITVDKIAASGGYLMACVGNKILAAPFSIIGSIGVLVQMPNFNRVLKENQVDFIQLTAGEYKRTVTMFGENTEAGKEKLKQEIEAVHQLFKNLIKENRPQVDVQKVATGEHWMGQQALTLNLVDEIKTSEDYLFERCEHANIYEICYETKKSFLNKLTATSHLLQEKAMKWFSTNYYQ